MEGLRETIEALGGTVRFERVCVPENDGIAERVDGVVAELPGYRIRAGFRLDSGRTQEQVFKDAEKDLLTCTAVWYRLDDGMISCPFSENFSSLSEFFVKATVSGCSA